MPPNSDETPGVGPRRPAARRFPASASSAARPAWWRIPPRKACRCAASAPRAPAARWCSGTAFPSTIRSAAGSTGRGSPPTNWTAWRSRAARPPASSAIAPWPAPSRCSRARRKGGVWRRGYEAGNRELARCLAGLRQFVVEAWPSPGTAGHSPPTATTSSRDRPRSGGSDGRGALRHRRRAPGPLDGARQPVFQNRHADESRKNGTALTHNSTSLGESLAALPAGVRTGFDFRCSASTHAKGFHSTLHVGGRGPPHRAALVFCRLCRRRRGRRRAMAAPQRALELHGGADVYRAAGTRRITWSPPACAWAAVRSCSTASSDRPMSRSGRCSFFAGVAPHLRRAGQPVSSAPARGVVVGTQASARCAASVYRSFRAPTLNELYREFRVRQHRPRRPIPTWCRRRCSAPKPAVDWVGEGSIFRVTAYRNSLDNLITNVTLSSRAERPLYASANAAAALSRGVEAAFPNACGNFTGELNYLFADSRYVTGFRVAQVPRHQGPRSSRTSAGHAGVACRAQLQPTSSMTT